MNGYDYHDESDADDEYERDMKSPGGQGDFPSSPIESDGPLSAEHTPTSYNRNGAPFPSPGGLITRWTIDQVADYIANLGLEQYSDNFAEEEINGEALVELLHEELQDLGVESVGHRMTILRNVYDIKVRQKIPVMHDHYVPPSADVNAPDAHATQDDVARIINQIKLRDERLLAAEEDLRILREDLNRALEESRRLREDTLPMIRKAKDSQPLPTPDSMNHDTLPSPRDAMHLEQQKSGGLSRKFSTKKLFLGAGGKMPSPTIHETATLGPSAAAQAASAQLSASMLSQGTQPSPRPSQLPSPTSPPYAQQGYPRSAAPPSSRYAQHAATTEDPWTNYNNSAASDRALPSGRRAPTNNQTTPTTIAEEIQPPPPRRQERERDNAAGVEFMKSFRVSMDEPCYKVLPVALRKYQIEDDWRQYSLYIVHGDSERCLGLQEKPLILFKQLASEGKKPMFMLRKHAAPQEGYSVERGDGGAAGPAGVGTVTGGTGALQGGRMSTYAGSGVQLPGGVM